MEAATWGRFWGGLGLGTTDEGVILRLEVFFQDSQRSIINLVVGMYLEGLKEVESSLVFEDQSEPIFNSLFLIVFHSGLEDVFDTLQ